MHIRCLQDSDLTSLRDLRGSARSADSPWMHPVTVSGLRGAAARHASAYDVVLIDGPTPSDRLDELARVAASINDAPIEDLEVEDEVYDPARLRDFEVANEARNRHLHRAVAVERATGAWVGHTVVLVEQERPQIGLQGDTTITREHRGHRLGVLLKATMLLHLPVVRPELRTIDTWNAASNRHMVQVNEQLGHQVLARRVEFQP